MSTKAPRVILITGSSKGFGFLFARDLARAGHRVAATARELSRLQELATLAGTEKLPINFYVLDVTRPETITTCINEVLRDHGRIDVLINNAGYGYISCFEFGSLRDIQCQFDTNVFGLTRVTQAVLPTMRRQHSGHIINISSAAVAGVAPTMGYYAASKWAVDALSEAMHFELKNSGIKISIICPGPYKTKFGDSMQFEPRTQAILGTGKRLQDHFLKEPQEVSDLVVKVVNSKRPKLRYVVGLAAKLIFFARKVLPGGIFIKLEEFLLRLNTLKKK